AQPTRDRALPLHDVPRAVEAATRATRAGTAGSRGDPALPRHRQRGTTRRAHGPRDRRLSGARRHDRVAVDGLGQPRPGGARPSRALRHRDRTRGAASHLRRWPTLLPRREPRARGDAGGAGRPRRADAGRTLRGRAHLAPAPGPLRADPAPAGSRRDRRVSGLLHPEPSDAQLAAIAAHSPDGPIVALNLNRYRARAAYPPGTPDADVSGREAYMRYGIVAFQA